MTPYYDDGNGIVIYHGDALAVLSEITMSGVQAAIMDPPYSSGARTEAQKSKKDHEGMLRGGRFSKPIDNDSLTTPGFVWLMREVSRAIWPALNPGGSLLSFIDWRQWPNLLGAIDAADFRINNMIVWDKEHFGLGYAFRHQHELILHASKGTPISFDHSVGTVIRVRREVSEHPSPKPVSLVERLIRVVSAPNDLIVDPFVGGGATLEAARNLRRRAIGIDTQERWCDASARRLSQAVLPMVAD